MKQRYGHLPLLKCSFPMPAALKVAAHSPQPCSIERVRFGADVEPPDRLIICV
jgi:hypothetical protein